MLSYLIVLTYAPYLRPRSRSTSSDRLIAGADLVEPLMLCHGDELWLYLAPQEPCPLPQASCEVLSLVTVAASWSTQKNLGRLHDSDTHWRPIAASCARSQKREALADMLEHALSTAAP